MFASTYSSPLGDYVFEAKVLDVIYEKYYERGSGVRVLDQLLSIEVTLPQGKSVVRLKNDYVPFEKGDELYVQSYKLAPEGPYKSFSFMNVKRDRGVYWILFLFALFVILIGGKQGFGALVGLLFSFAVILKLMVPALLSGVHPVFVGLLGSLFILLVTFYTSHGLNRKSIAAFIGVSGTLILVGFFATYAIGETRLTGFSEHSFTLYNLARIPFDFVGLLTAGILIAVIGVLDDAAVTQASAVFALASETSLRGIRLFWKAMEVGRDHISALVNTLVLAYTGAALPLVLLFVFNHYSPSFALSVEIMAEEVVRTLIATMALVLAVPITTLVAVFFVKAATRETDTFREECVKHGGHYH